MVHDRPCCRVDDKHLFRVEYGKRSKHNAKDRSSDNAYQNHEKMARAGKHESPDGEIMYPALHEYTADTESATRNGMDINALGRAYPGIEQRRR